MLEDDPRDFISTGSEWSFDLVQEYDREIAKIAESYGLDTYPNQIEIISAEQMMDAYASVGMPVGYQHWSFGKQFVSIEKNYRRGQMGLAYEIVINSNPCIAYLMEENTMTMQALVIAHACYGHNSFFKGNYLFQTWTDASSIIDYLVFAKNYINTCEEKYGIDEVEQILDACHALMNHGVDRYKRPYPISAAEEKQRQKDREAMLQAQVNDLWRTIPKLGGSEKEIEQARFPAEPQENILYFLEKKAPLLEPWQREIVRIVRKISQYFYPQRQTQVMNEGWATFWHYTLLNDLYAQGKVTDGFMFEFLQSHSGVVFQPEFDSKYYSGINPYALGFAMFQDIKRICENPTEEDKRWFPDFAGSDWLATIKFAMQNFKDESFVQQFLSPKVMRDFKFFAILDDDQDKELEVSAIHDDEGYRRVREALSAQYNLSMNEPNIQVYDVDVRGSRAMTLRHFQHNRRPLADDSAQEVLKHLHTLWKFDVTLESVDNDKVTDTWHCPMPVANDEE
ncbi:MAG: SpoVR family protein [Pseudomonadota bacterium]|nr:SpoVR family protein [Gammaproteobacteria bacterium]MEC8010816.1 SpoVR family protein [Pseudomonadota bacterium]